MISRDDLESLARREARKGSPVLSFYLNTDLSQAANVNRAFEVVLKDLLREIERQLDEDERQEFAADAGRVLRFVEDYREPKRGLVMFCDDSEDFFWHRELNVSVRDGAWWGETPYLRPLVELMDEYERYGVALTDRQRARLFTVYQGEIEEHRETEARADVRHIKSSGLDHLRSQMNIERKADEHAHWHLKHVAELLSRLASKYEFDRLILAGTDEATSHLSALLPARLQPRVVRQMNMPVDVSDAYMLEETLKVEQEVERECEVALVGELLEAAGRHERAVVKLGATLRAIQEWRVWQLVYADGFAPPGGQCVNCGALYAEKKASCDYCGQAVRGVSDLIDRADARVFEMSGKVEEVRGEAASRLREEGSIGALLRW
jgi:peptide chain release factor subunit 1